MQVDFIQPDLNTRESLLGRIPDFTHKNTSAVSPSFLRVYSLDIHKEAVFLLKKNTKWNEL